MGEAEELAGRAWARLGGRGEDQAVVFLYVTQSRLKEVTWSGSTNPFLF